MVLACDKALVRAHHAYWLIVRTMTVLKLVNGCSTSLCQQLIAHADTTDGLAAAAHLFSYDVYSILAHVRVARAVGQE